MPYRRIVINVQYDDDAKPSPVITDTRMAATVARNIFNKNIMLLREEAYLLCLDEQGKLLGWDLIGIGGRCSVTVEGKLVCFTALASIAAAVILVHNHPSGNPKPSQADVEITRNLSEALSAWNVTLFDSQILTQDDYFSFREEGLL